MMLSKKEIALLSFVLFNLIDGISLFLQPSEFRDDLSGFLGIIPLVLYISWAIKVVTE